jgi:hypothetical protein
LLFDGQIALGDLVLQLAVVLQRLADHKERFGSVIAGEGRFDLGLTLLDPPIHQAGQHSRVAFPRQDGIQNRQPTLPSEVARARDANAGSFH